MSSRNVGPSGWYTGVTYAARALLAAPPSGATSRAASLHLGGAPPRSDGPRRPAVSGLLLSTVAETVILSSDSPCASSGNIVPSALDGDGQRDGRLVEARRQACSVELRGAEPLGLAGLERAAAEMKRLRIRERSAARRERDVAADLAGQIEREPRARRRPRPASRARAFRRSRRGRRARRRARERRRGARSRDACHRAPGAPDRRAAAAAASCWPRDWCIVHAPRDARAGRSGARARSTVPLAGPCVISSGASTTHMPSGSCRVLPSSVQRRAASGRSPAARDRSRPGRSSTAARARCAAPVSRRWSRSRPAPAPRSPSSTSMRTSDDVQLVVCT